MLALHESLRKPHRHLWYSIFPHAQACGSLFNKNCMIYMWCCIDRLDFTDTPDIEHKTGVTKLMNVSSFPSHLQIETWIRLLSFGSQPQVLGLKRAEMLAAGVSYFPPLEQFCQTHNP